MSQLRLRSALSALDVTCARWLIFFEGLEALGRAFLLDLGRPGSLLAASGPPFSIVSDGT